MSDHARNQPTTMDPANLNGVAIVSVEGASRLGRVKDVLFDTAPLGVAALLAADHAGESIVRFDRVSSFGSDAVMVETPDASEHTLQPSNQLRTLAEIRRLKVVDDTGGYVGTVKALEFDTRTGRVERLTAQSGGNGFLGIGAGQRTTVEAQDIRSVGNDLITISRPSAAPATD